MLEMLLINQNFIHRRNFELGTGNVDILPHAGYTPHEGNGIRFRSDKISPFSLGRVTG